MTKRHGNKMHHQVLLDIHRSQLLEEHAAAKGVKTAALLRTIVYSYLETTLGDQYQAAELADQGFYKLTPIQKKRHARLIGDQVEPTPEEALRAFVNQLETKSR